MSLHTCTSHRYRWWHLFYSALCSYCLSLESTQENMIYYAIIIIMQCKITCVFLCNLAFLISSFAHFLQVGDITFIIGSVVRLYQCLAALKLLTQGLVFHCMTDKTLKNNIVQIINLLGTVSIYPSISIYIYIYTVPSRLIICIYIYIQKALKTEVWFKSNTQRTTNFQ